MGLGCESAKKGMWTEKVLRIIREVDTLEVYRGVKIGGDNPSRALVTGCF